jgi:hypothetical protein
VKPDYIGIYWRGGPIPQWRRECTDQLLSLYPDAVVLSDVSESGTRAIGVEESDRWRLDMCFKHRRFLWVDNDIWLDSKLCLTEQPGMADEYHTRHWSIMWSGDSPELFVARHAIDLRKEQKICKLRITGTHFASDRNGNKCDRNL